MSSRILTLPSEFLHHLHNLAMLHGLDYGSWTFPNLLPWTAFALFYFSTHALHFSICERTASSCVFLLDIQFLSHPHSPAWSLNMAFSLFHALLPLKLRLCRWNPLTREPGSGQAEAKIQCELRYRAAPMKGKKCTFPNSSSQSWHRFVIWGSEWKLFFFG